MVTFITGITGLLGSALAETRRNNDRIIGIYRGDYQMTDSPAVSYNICDVCDAGALSNAFGRAEIDHIVHTAGIADTDICENDAYYKMAYRSNVNGTENMIEFARRKKAKLVYISTNAVFDGENAPYDEEAIPHPINRYGAIKLECERMVHEQLPDSLIIRPILMYGINNPHERMCFFTRILERLRANEVVNIVDDVFENPLLSYYCSEMIWKLLDKNACGIYHIAGKDILSRYDAAQLISRVFSLEGNLIRPVSSYFFKHIAPRPKNTSYCTRKIEQALDVEPIRFEEGLRILKTMMEKTTTGCHEGI